MARNNKTKRLARGARTASKLVVVGAQQAMKVPAVRQARSRIEKAAVNKVTQKIDRASRRAATYIDHV